MWVWGFGREGDESGSEVGLQVHFLLALSALLSKMDNDRPPTVVQSIYNDHNIRFPSPQHMNTR